MAESFRSPRKVLRRLRLAPLAARTLRSWPRYLWHYALGLVPASPYQFRNGARLQIGRGVDHVPIIEIFMRNDYGEVPDGAVVLDLGANIGAFSVYAATTARAVTVFAYEPMSDFFRLLQHNVRINGLDHNVKFFNVAVGSDSRDRNLIVGSERFSFPTTVDALYRGTSTLRVPCTSLEQIFSANRLSRVDLLKIDCEGAEYEILYGSPPRIFEKIVEIRLEYHDLGIERCSAKSLKEFLKSQNYVITFDKAMTETGGILWARKR
jgi:FkbM family methyltransferase